ncbi:MAG: response regulator, partial [bacterium]|nr:response regulator [bacterium]
MKALVLTSATGHKLDIITWLEEMDGEVITATSLKQALGLVESDPTIDLVIAAMDTAGDILAELASGIKGDPRLNPIPIIIAAPHLDDEAVNKLLSLEIDDIIALPSSRKTFEAKVHAALANGKYTALLVDDEPAILELLESFLALERYIPLTATTAEEAMEILEKNTVDIIVTDIMLPGMSGIELLSKVKESYSHIPVILITGFSGRYTPRDAISMGADGYFAKPFHNIELIYTLRRALSRYRRPGGTPSTTNCRT